MGALMGRMRRRCFTPTASSIDVLGTSPLAPGEVALNATVPYKPMLREDGAPYPYDEHENHVPEAKG
jgi:hypothetical protein